MVSFVVMRCNVNNLKVHEMHPASTGNFGKIVELIQGCISCTINCM